MKHLLLVALIIGIPFWIIWKLGSFIFGGETWDNIVGTCFLLAVVAFFIYFCYAVLSVLFGWMV